MDALTEFAVYGGAEWGAASLAPGEAAISRMAKIGMSSWRSGSYETASQVSKASLMRAHLESKAGFANEAAKHSINNKFADQPVRRFLNQRLRNIKNIPNYVDPTRLPGAMRRATSRRVEERAIARHVRGVMKSSTATAAYKPGAAWGNKGVTKFQATATRLGMTSKQLSGHMAGRGLKMVGRAFNVMIAWDIGNMVGQGAVAGMNSIAELGARARNNSPNRPSYYTGSVATTMRQASLAAIHNSQMSTRPYMGGEASNFHG